MQFEVIDTHPSAFLTVKGFFPSQLLIFLVKNSWDDSFRFSTLFTVCLWDPSRAPHLQDIGGVKIGQFGMDRGSEEVIPGVRFPDIKLVFNELGPNFFSLGQDVSYYENLNKLGREFKQQFLLSMNDVVFNADLLKRTLSEEVMKVSLLRDVPLSTVNGIFFRTVHGGHRKKFEFTYKAPVDSDNPFDSTITPFKFEIEVPESTFPPSNMYVLIGRNGVGKTRILDKMTRALVHRNLNHDLKFGEFVFTPDNLEAEAPRFNSFDSIVSVAFSAFDPFEPLSEPDGYKDVHYCYVGLKKKKKMESAENEAGIIELKNISDLETDLIESFRAIKRSGKIDRWRAVIGMLETDPMFKEASIGKIEKLPHEEADFEKEMRSRYEKLSSGHKIVLLIVTSLVEYVQEKTIVLIDEPESHLHPPLLSSLARALSFLLTTQNAIAIVATHSPVMLQEVPKKCVLIMERFGRAVRISKPRLETFGENVGMLTQLIFGLEATSSGFHRLIQDKIDELGTAASYESVVAAFNNQLGGEAKAMIITILREAEIRRLRGKGFD